MSEMSDRDGDLQGRAPVSVTGSTSTERPRPGRRFTRRSAVTLLSGVAAAGLVLILVEPTRRLLMPAARPFPDWAYTMPKGGEAYAAAYSRLDLMATLPCFCGCMAFEQPHGGLRDCFVNPSGEIDPHAAFCETCQEEAIDAVAWDKQGVGWGEIHERIVSKYADRDSGAGGIGCGGASAAGTGEGAACTP
jgi:uncharacterized protein with PCYCGC motif